MPTSAELAQRLRNQYPTQTAKYQRDDDLVNEWVKTHPQDAPLVSATSATPSTSTGREEKGVSASLTPLAMRVVPSIAGSAFGPLGGAIGSGGGELAAQIYEYLGENKPFRPLQVGAQTAIGAIPFSKAKDASRILSVVKQAAKGGVMGGSSTLLTKVADKELPSMKDMAIGVGGGAILGGGTQAVLGRNGKKLIDTVEKKPMNISDILPGNGPTTTLKNVPTKKLKPGDIKFLNPTNPVPKAKDIELDQLYEFPSVQKMPKEIQPEISRLLRENEGFEAQRRGVQPHPRTKALAEYLTVPLQKLKPGTALNAEELVAYRDALASTMTEQMDVAKKIAANPHATDQDRLRLSHLVDKSTTLLASYRGAKAETGRALGMLRTKARILELGDASFQQKLMEAPGFRGNIDKIAQAMVAAGDDPIKQLTILRQSSGTAYDKATAFYYNSLLSGVKTHIRNTLGNTFNMVANLANPIVAAPVDALRVAVKGGQREVFLGEAGQQITATLAAMPKAFSKFMFSLRNGFDLDMVKGHLGGKLDTNNLVEAPGGVMTNWPSRLLLASDNFFRTLAKDQELYASAYAAARKAGKTHPKQISDFMSNLLTDEKFVNQADEFAARAVFQEDPGVIVNSMLRWKNDPAVSKPIRGLLTFVTPFVRTPANILRQGIEASPVGFGMKAANAGGRTGAQAQGRATTGTALVLGPIALLAGSGRLSGNGPTDPAQRAALYESGWQPNSVKIGETWVKYQLFQPWSVPLSVVANAWDKFQESDQSDEAAESTMLTAVAAAGSSIIDQSFLSGVNGLLDAVSDPERHGASFLATAAQGMVPASGLLRNVTQAVDPVVRKPESIKEAVQSIIPGQSQKVPARLTRFGEPVKRPGGPIRRGFIVPEMSEEITDPVAQHLKQTGVELQIPRARIVRRGEESTLTREQKHIIEQAIGKERRDYLERAPRATERAITNALSDKVRQINSRAYHMLRTGKPLTLETLSPVARKKLSKQQIDAAYARYQQAE